jgi:hypothetical protein
VRVSQGKFDSIQVADGEMNMLFKKLSKKDSVTKVKGLEELAALFPQRVADELTAVLPAWVRRLLSTSR